MSKSVIAETGGLVARAATAAAERPWRLASTALSLLTIGAVLAATLVFLLFFKLPDVQVLKASGALRVGISQLGWVSAGAETRPDEMARAISAVDRGIAELRRELTAASVDLPQSSDFEQRWAITRTALATLPVTPAAESVLRQASESAHALAAAVESQVEARRETVERSLKIVATLALAVLAWPIGMLWRQRQHMRASLHEFSDTLISGGWQDAVQRLRNDRFGAPSAFDALASGVEETIGESERRWQALADLSADWFWETDVQHRLTWHSGVTPDYALPGHMLADLMGKRRDELPNYEEPAMGWRRLHALMDQRQSFRDVTFAVHAREENRVLWMSISGRPRFDGAGRCVGYEGVGRDVTESRQAHERLAASEQRWSLMAGLAADWYWETDAEHRLLPMSPEVYRRFVAFADKLEGRTRWEAHREALSPEAWAEHRTDLEARRPFRGLQFDLELADGRVVWMSLSGIPRFDGQGQFLGYHGVGRDVTVRKEAERLLLRHNEQLQAAVAGRTRELEQMNRDLEAFARQLAHELRTPIGHVQGLAELLDARAGDRLAPDERQLLMLQVRAARSMRDTVDALLELARSTMQAMPMEAFDLSALAEAALSELPVIERRAPVQWRIEPGVRVMGARPALRIVLANLLGNAAKFTRNVAAPSVTLSARAAADGRICVSVQDNGAGFDSRYAERLFVPFNRLHTAEEFHGTGIGLTIVQRIVERHGGTVKARGEVGAGATFEFTLPAAPDSLA